MSETDQKTDTQDKGQPPVISDFRKASDHNPERPAGVSLWLHHKRDGGGAFLDGYVRIGDRKVHVYGNFTALDEHAAKHSENHPVIRIRAKHPEDAGILGKAGGWPQNAKKNGGPVNYRTLVVKVGKEIFYPTVFDGIGEARKYLGFEGEPRRAMSTESAQASAGQEQGAAPSPF